MWRRLVLGTCGLWALSACGAAQSAPDSAENQHTVEAPDADEPSPAESPDADGPSPGEKQKAEPAEPVFTENMSVADAERAIPQGTPRLNVEQEALAKPLQEPNAFESCKLGSGHFKVRVAVWNGKAVGVDLGTTPKNPKLAECLTARIRELSWPDRVRSLNTVEFQY